MLITESFVMLNYPKTGSSFARKVIKDLYAREPRRRFGGRWCKELILPNIRHESEPNQHGCYSQIPRRYRNREVVSIVRSPYERFISNFEFRYWVNNPILQASVVQERFPTFPELSLDQYVDFDALVAKAVSKVALGAQTVQFVQLFSRQFPKTIDDSLDLATAIDGLANITFLRQENLNLELMSFLRRKGFSNEETAFIETHEPVNVTPGGSPNRDALWTAKALDYVRTTEGLLFEILAAMGFCYDPPLAWHADRLQSADSVAIQYRRIARADLPYYPPSY
jgi:hypothetical protein